MSAIITSPEDVRRFVGEAVTEALRETLPRLVREASYKEFLSQEEVRRLTSWSNAKLRYLRAKRRLEFVPLGQRTFLYTTGSVLRFLDDNKIRVREDLVPTWAEAQEAGPRSPLRGRLAAPGSPQP